MSTLIIYLPAGMPGPTTEYSYTLTADGHTATRHASTTAALLPDPGRTGEVVAVLPVRALSWQRVTLPQGATTSPARLRSVLEGLLEEQLLDDPAELHFALAPHAHIGAPAWVAVCEREWLQAHLLALEAAGRSAERIVPEFAPAPTPSDADATPEVFALGVPEDAFVVLTAQGNERDAVCVLPLNAATLALAVQDSDAPPKVHAEPAVAAMTEKWLNRPPELSTYSQRALAAARSEWNLAQLDFASSGRIRAMRSATGAFNSFFRAPQWRAGRWALGLAVIAQLIGLNVWAFKERQSLTAKEGGVRGILQQTFPNVRVVVDAPVQMEREVAQLRQQAGSVSRRDLEPLLAAAGAALPKDKTPTQIEFANAQLRLTGVSLSAEEMDAANQRLRADGFTARQQDRHLLIQSAENDAR